MTERSQLIQRHLALYAAEADDVWKQVHGEAMLCYDVQDCVKYGLLLLDRIKRANQDWASYVKDDCTTFSWDTAGEIADVYRGWQQLSRRVLTCVECCERRGYPIEGATQFREACREVNLLPLDLGAVRESIEALQNGQGITFTSIADALPHQARP